MVQWLRLGAFTAMSMSLTPGQGTKISQVMWGEEIRRQYFLRDNFSPKFSEDSRI